MPTNPYINVRCLSVSEIAEKWYREGIVGVPRQTIEDEMRRAFVNMAPGRDWRNEGLVQVDEVCDIETLPQPDRQVTMDWVRDFAEKQGWPLPRFWFPDEAPAPRGRGRPSNRHEILQELERRAECGELASTVTDQARELHAWLIEQGLKPIKPDTISRQISKRFRSLKAEQCST